MNDKEREQIRKILEQLLDKKELVRKKDLKLIVRENLEDLIEKREWYSNQELFERIESLSASLEETRQYVTKYNNLVKKATETKKQADKNRIELERLNASEESSNQLKDTIKSNIGLTISIILMLVGVGSLIFTIAINLM